MTFDIATLPSEQKTCRFHPNQLVHLDRLRIPSHVAIIPDGNRRWAKQRLSSPETGHREGADMLMEIIKAAQELGVRFLTIYSFSTENWSRPADEIAALMAIYATYLTDNCEEMVQSGIRLETIGHLEKLPLFLREVIQETKQATRHCQSITLILALNYGSRDEMCRAVKNMLEDFERQQLTKADISEEVIASYLDTHEWGDPDLLIRTSGEFRVSNFLLWQVCYAEIHIAPILWPDFKPQNLLDAIIDYQNRERRWGGD